MILGKYPKVKGGRIEINLALLVATFFSTFAAWYFFFDRTYMNAALFSVGMMSMLGTHELGHKISAWRNGVESTLPYFIPAPTSLGTLGAVINVKSPIPTKEALVEMGAAGPLMGFAIAIPITMVGLSFSKFDPLGDSLPFMPPIFSLLQYVVLGGVSGYLRLNPLTFAGWVVILLTTFNLLPAGQLDGGHISRGLLDRQRHQFLTRTIGFSLVITGLLIPESPFWIWGFLIVVAFRGYHSGALDDVSPLSRRHKVLAAIAMLVFLLCLPIPA